jgi:hypothetical protein
MSGESYVVRTSGRLPCDPQRAWEKVCFYEHIALRPSWILRTALPVPVRTTGRYRAVGDVSRCLYSDGGYLTKQIRQIVPGRRIDFDIVEQSIRYAGRIVLQGGTICVVPRGDGTCSIEMLTRYELRFRWLQVLRPFINRVVGAMHKVVLRDMQVRLETRLSPDRMAAFRLACDAALGATNTGDSHR